MENAQADDVELELDLEPEPDPPAPEAAGDPAAEAFARLLGDNGITVGGTVTAVATPADGAPIAEVASLPT